MSKSKIIISDLNLSESLTPLSEKEQDQIRGGGVPVNQIKGEPSKPRSPKYFIKYVYPQENQNRVLEA